MISYQIYVVDDEPALARGIALTLEKDYDTRAFFSAGTALEAMKKARPDLVLLDIGMPEMNGIQALEVIKRDFHETLVIMISAFEDIDTVISAMKLGAYDYVVKPLQIDTLEMTIHNALESIRLKKEVKTLQEKYLKENLPCFIGESKAISDVMQFVQTVARSPDTPVLILGQSGTGKELIAGAIHYRSPNFKGPFIAVNCAAIPKDLIESELFGYEKGAFSGANPSGKKGFVEQAANGTLFLDEIGDLSPEAQAKLLRFLESGEFHRVGGDRTICIRTRVVSATNKDLKAMIENGTFREDLYFRIGVISVKIPSLNHRREDILPIARYFLVQFGEKFGKNITGISPEAESVLERFHFRGNVRELKNLIELAVLTANGAELTVADFGIQAPELSGPLSRVQPAGRPLIPRQGVDITSILEMYEKQYIEEALLLSRGNETRAAQLLKLKPTTFRYRRQKFGIPCPDLREPGMP